MAYTKVQDGYTSLQAFSEAQNVELSYNEDGQLLTGSFMDYCMPRADDVPQIDFSYNEVPCSRNPLGVKGAGEAGAIGAPPAVINAVVDALSERGVRHVDMPATPERLWRAANEPQQAA